MQALRGRAPASPPTRSLLDEIKAHRVEADVTLAALTALWCSSSLVATHLKEDLELQLREGIEDMKRLKHALAGAPVGPGTYRLIETEKPGEDLNRERAAHGTDGKNRRSFYPLLGRLQLPFAAKLIPSARPRQPGPLNSTLKQLQAEVVEGRLRKNYGRQFVIRR